MDGNRDEADRCIEIALTLINTSEYEKAEKFLKKAQNLFPSERAAQLLQHVGKMSGSSNKNTGPRQRKPVNSTVTDEKENTAHDISKNYTKDQLELVQKVKKCKDYYEVLSVTKEATDSDVKKAYKKLALQLHPDKNHAPGASEAFKTVGNAVATLTDAKKRKEYDLFGNQSNRVGNGGGGNQHFNRYSSTFHHHHNTFEFDRFESEISPEELFNMFFSQGRRQQYTNGGSHHHESGPQPSLAFGLILVLILISMLSSFFTSDPLYSLNHTSKYHVQRHTTHLGVPYFVKESFSEEYQGSIGRLENSVEEDYINTMKQNCFRERNYREAMIARARSFGSRTQAAQAQALKTPSCDNLAKIGLTRYSLY